MSATRCCGRCRNPHTSDCAHRSCKCCTEKRCRCHNGRDAEVIQYDAPPWVKDALTGDFNA